VQSWAIRPRSSSDKPLNRSRAVGRTKGFKSTSGTPGSRVGGKHERREAPSRSLSTICDGPSSGGSPQLLVLSGNAGFDLWKRPLRPEEPLPGLLFIRETAEKDAFDDEHEKRQGAQENSRSDREFRKDTFHRPHLLSTCGNVRSMCRSS